MPRNSSDSYDYQNDHRTIFKNSPPLIIGHYSFSSLEQSVISSLFIIFICHYECYSSSSSSVCSSGLSHPDGTSNRRNFTRARTRSNIVYILSFSGMFFRASKKSENSKMGEGICLIFSRQKAY